MAKICYVQKRFSAAHEDVIERANEIIDIYQRQGYLLTLRQLYYQFVSRDLIANKVSEYKRLGGIVNDARLAGLIDWNSIEDRTRNLEALPHWKAPSEIVSACAEQFNIDKWARQKNRVEVWIEKEALAGVFARICRELDVPYLCCRGYTSQSEMWSAAMRLRTYQKLKQLPCILHFGDHDPSGIDMTRDIEERMKIFGANIHLQRIALNMNQVQQYSPPPNPAKDVDPRFASYLSTYGDESWELDALEPQTLANLVRVEVEKLRDRKKWNEAVKDEQLDRRQLSDVAEHWNDLVSRLNNPI